MLISAVLRCFRTAIPLLLVVVVTSDLQLVGASRSAAGAQHNLADFRYPYDSVLSPLLRALSEHGGSLWTPGEKKKVKPDYKYVRYLTEVYKKSPREKRGSLGRRTYNTVRLIKAQDECLVQTNSGERIKAKAQLLPSGSDGVLFWCERPCGVMVIPERERDSPLLTCALMHTDSLFGMQIYIFFNCLNIEKVL